MNNVCKKLFKCKILAGVSGFFSKHFRKAKTTLKTHSTTSHRLPSKEIGEED
jgi:hypothetical protein